MAVRETVPELDELLEAMGDAGARVSDIDACEGAAGNISLLIGWPIEVRDRFPVTEPIRLPQPAPGLAGKVVIASGSGRRLRDIRRDPAANLGAVRVDQGGETGVLNVARHRRFERLTSELNSHLAVHEDHVQRTQSRFNALIHAQPPHLTYLSQVPEYRDQSTMNRRLMRWEPETIVQLPEGIGVLPFILPGSPDLMRANVAWLRTHQVVLWGKHGVMARSDTSVRHAADLVDYLEAAARYEYMDLLSGGRGEGLTEAELRGVVRAFGVKTSLV